MTDVKKDRVWAEIDLDALDFNFDLVRKHAGDKKVLAVVKADAYGHGAVVCARELEARGADYFAVATADEATELRDAGIVTPILILGYTPPCRIVEMAERNVTVGVGSIEDALAYSKELGDRKIKVHIKLNTGMSRLGIDTRDTTAAADEIQAIAEVKNLDTEGVFTHFAVADVSAGTDFTNTQYGRFTNAVGEAERRGVKFAIRHCANSAAVVQYKKTHMDMVRAGIVLYGAPPDEEMESVCGFRPVMTVKTRVAALHRLDKDDTVSYGRTWSPESGAVTATCMIGYADGLHRAMSGKVAFTHKSGKAPQVGRICMDMCMADVTGLDVAKGDEITVFGRNAATATELASAAGTISYELFCAMSKRVNRIYLRNGQAVK